MLRCNLQSSENVALPPWQANLSRSCFILYAPSHDGAPLTYYLLSTLPANKVFGRQGCYSAKTRGTRNLADYRPTDPFWHLKRNTDFEFGAIELLHVDIFILVVSF